MTVLILHGIEGHAGIHWQQWLHAELTQRGYNVLMPHLPNSDHPERQTWLTEVKKAAAEVNPKDLIIVAHSLGVVSALDYLEANQAYVLVSVSGFAADYGAELNSYFLNEKSIDFKKVNSNLRQAFVLYGDDDPYVPQTALKHLADKLGIKNPIIIPKGGHFNTEAGFNKFPQLLKMILSIR